MTFRIIISKRGEIDACCQDWLVGEYCECEPYIVAFYINGKRVQPCLM